MNKQWLEDYFDVKKLTDGRYAGIQLMLFTTSIVVGLDDVGYSGRYCYASTEDARAALESWDGVGDPTGPWIKYKGKGGERLGPGAIGDQQ